jgi:hypothetical protein
MKVGKLFINSVTKLVAAARFAVKNSGDHGCEWCKSQPNCPQCVAYSRLQAALKPFEPDTPKLDLPSDRN